MGEAVGERDSQKGREMKQRSYVVEKYYRKYQVYCLDYVLNQRSTWGAPWKLKKDAERAAERAREYSRRAGYTIIEDLEKGETKCV